MTDSELLVLQAERIQWLRAALHLVATSGAEEGFLSDLARRALAEDRKRMQPLQEASNG